MALTESDLQTMREALVRAIATGQRRVRFGDREVEYLSISEMQRALEFLDKEIAQASDTPRVRRVMVNMEDGF